MAHNADSKPVILPDDLHGSMSDNPPDAASSVSSPPDDIYTVKEERKGNKLDWIKSEPDSSPRELDGHVTSHVEWDGHMISQGGLGEVKIEPALPLPEETEGLSNEVCRDIKHEDVLMPKTCVDKSETCFTEDNVNELDSNGGAITFADIFTVDSTGGLTGDNSVNLFIHSAAGVIGVDGMTFNGVTSLAGNAAGDTLRNTGDISYSLSATANQFGDGTTTFSVIENVDAVVNAGNV